MKSILFENTSGNNFKLIKEVGITDTRFRTDLKHDSVDILLDNAMYPDLYVDESDAVVIWEVDIESRSWGIKDISANIIAVRFNYTINDLESMKTVEEKEIDITSTNTKGYKIEIGSRSEGNQLVPSGITLDEKTKTITVDF